MTIIIGARLQGFTTPGSMGIVKNTRFVNCFWPKLDYPTRIFADGSNGIEVLGNTPRNVWFPDDIVFLPYHPDALYPAEKAVLQAYPFRRGLVNLSPIEAQIWQDAYDAAVSSFPSTHAVYQTQREANFLRHYEEKSRVDKTLTQDSVTTYADGSKVIIPAGTVITKIEYDEFIAELSAKEADDIASGKTDPALTAATKDFKHVADGRDLVKAVIDVGKVK